MKIGICEWNIPLEGSEARFEWASHAGLGAMEIDMGAAATTPNLVKELREKWNIATPTLGLNVCCGVPMPDPSRRAELESAFRDAVATATELGVQKLQVPSFVASWIVTDDDFNHTIDRFRYLLDLVEGTDLLVGTENGLGAEKQLEMLERLNTPNLKIYYDTRNAYSMSGLDSSAILDQLYPHVCEVHLKDGVGDGPSCPLGAGDSGFFETFAILKDRGYDGWMLLENDYTSIEECRADMETTQTFFN